VLLRHLPASTAESHWLLTGIFDVSAGIRDERFRIQVKVLPGWKPTCEFCSVYLIRASLSDAVDSRGK
jgi:hypothetical protein